MKKRQKNAKIFNKLRIKFVLNIILLYYNLKNLIILEIEIFDDISIEILLQYNFLAYFLYIFNKA